MIEEISQKVDHHIISHIHIHNICENIHILTHKNICEIRDSRIQDLILIISIQVIKSQEN